MESCTAMTTWMIDSYSPSPAQPSPAQPGSLLATSCDILEKYSAYGRNPSFIITQGILASKGVGDGMANGKKKLVFLAQIRENLIFQKVCFMDREKIFSHFIEVKFIIETVFQFLKVSKTLVVTSALVNSVDKLLHF